MQHYEIEDRWIAHQNNSTQHRFPDQWNQIERQDWEVAMLTERKNAGNIQIKRAALSIQPTEDKNRSIGKRNIHIEDGSKHKCKENFYQFLSFS